MNTIRDHLNEVRENIQKACEKAGRSPQEVTLIAVSKTKPLFMLEEAYEAGARDFGENKVQEIFRKNTGTSGRCPLAYDRPPAAQQGTSGYGQSSPDPFCGFFTAWQSRLNQEAAKKDISSGHSYWKSMWQKRRANLACCLEDAEEAVTGRLQHFPHVQYRGSYDHCAFCR